MPRHVSYTHPAHHISKEQYKTMVDAEPVTREEEKRLFLAYKAGDEEALNALIRANQRFALKWASKSMGRGLPLPDLVCAANTGLLIAAQKFDPERGYKFISYAVHWIRQQINKEVTDHRRTIRINATADKQVQQQSRIRWTLAQKLGRSPSRAEVLDAYEDEYGTLPTNWDDVQAAYGGSASLDEMLRDDGQELNGHGILADENTPDPIDTVHAEQAQAAIKDALAKLPERVADIVTLYYGLMDNLPHTLDEIGHLYGITRERTRQLRNAGLDQLKRRCPDLAALTE